jgi:hypothetical protein
LTHLKDVFPAIFDIVIPLYRGPWPFVSVQIVTYNRSAFLLQAGDASAAGRWLRAASGCAIFWKWVGCWLEVSNIYYCAQRKKCFSTIYGMIV